MARRLNKIIAIALIFISATLMGQEDEERFNEKDYKEKEQFEKFYRRRKIVSAWQINKLKDGALVVKLKTNGILIKELIKKGNVKYAERVRLETAGINVNIVRAFMGYYTFSKVYFIYSHSSDSLLKGIRENIFLDSNLVIDPKIRMVEDFYLLAENDRHYNSSIGFVKEDSAKFVSERGNATGEEGLIIKNKYGHQLKKPFPYYAFSTHITWQQMPPVTYIPINGVAVPFNTAASGNKKNRVSFKHNGETISVSIPKFLIFEKLVGRVENLNDILYQYYKQSPMPLRINQSVQPFLY